MHMINKKDLNSNEMDTLTKSCVQRLSYPPVEKCRRMKRPQFLSEN